LNWAAALPIIYDAFKVGWEAAYPSVPYFFKGQALPDLTEIETPFVKFRIVPQRIKQSAMAPSPPKRKWGYIMVEIFVPRKTGDLVVFQMLDTLEQIFVAQSVSTIVFSACTPYSPVSGIDWSSQSFPVAFYFD